jgi:hypothetical protein
MSPAQNRRTGGNEGRTPEAHSTLSYPRVDSTERGVGRPLEGILALFLLTKVDLPLARHFLAASDSGLYAAGAIIAKVAYWGPQFLVVVFSRVFRWPEIPGLCWRGPQPPSPCSGGCGDGWLGHRRTVRRRVGVRPASGWATDIASLDDLAGESA